MTKTRRRRLKVVTAARRRSSLKIYRVRPGGVYAFLDPRRLCITSFLPLFLCAFRPPIAGSEFGTVGSRPAAAAPRRATRSRSDARGTRKTRRRTAHAEELSRRSRLLPGRPERGAGERVHVQQNRDLPAHDAALQRSQEEFRACHPVRS